MALAEHFNMVMYILMALLLGLVVLEIFTGRISTFLVGIVSFAKSLFGGGLPYDVGSGL